MAEGIILAGYLLSKNEFLDIFKEWYEKRGDEFKDALKEQILDPLEEQFIKNNVNEKIRRYDYILKKDANIESTIEFFKKWDNIQQEYLKNPGVQLLAGFTDDNGKSFQWSSVVEESDFLGKNTVNVSFNKMINTIKDVERQNKINDILNTHYKDMLNSLSKPLSREEAYMVHKQIGGRGSSLNRSDFIEHFTHKHLNTIFFKNNRSGGLGKKMDAFMNHIGSMDITVFKWLKNQDIDIEISSLPEGHFPIDISFINLLLDSLNNISWVRGGDIVVIGDDKQVAYNIQLKTTKKTNQSWYIGVTELYNSIKKIYESEDLANDMYEKLKISTANEIESAGAEETINNEILNTVLESLLK